MNGAQRYKASEKGKATQRRHYAKAKSDVFNHYGRSCARCGFDNEVALTIDHEGQKGALHRTAAGFRYAGIHLYRWLRRNGFPSGFRTLCYNCQIIVYREHQSTNV